MFYLNGHIRKWNFFHILEKVMDDITNVYDRNHGNFVITYHKYLKSFDWISVSYEWSFAWESRVIYIADIVIPYNNFLKRQFGEFCVFFNKDSYKDEGCYSFNFHVGYPDIKSLHKLAMVELFKQNLILPRGWSFMFGSFSLFYGRYCLNGNDRNFIIHNKLLLNKLSIKLGKKLKPVLSCEEYPYIEDIVNNLCEETFSYYKEYVDDIYSSIDI